MSHQGIWETSKKDKKGGQRLNSIFSQTRLCLDNCGNSTASWQLQHKVDNLEVEDNNSTIGDNERISQMQEWTSR